MTAITVLTGAETYYQNLMESVIQQSCFICDFRPDRVFCDMPVESLKAFDEIESLATYPRNTILFAEGRTAHSSIDLGVPETGPCLQVDATASNW